MMFNINTIRLNDVEFKQSNVEGEEHRKFVASVACAHPISGTPT